MISATKAPTIAVRALARLVASTAAFQTLVGAEGENAAAKEADALNHVYWQEADDRLDEEDENGAMVHPRPRAIISDHQEEEDNRGTAEWVTTASLTLTIEAPEPETISGGDPGEIRDRYDWWSEVHGALKQQMRDNIPAAPHERLNVQRFRLIGYGEVRFEEPTPFFDVCWQCDYFG